MQTNPKHALLAAALATACGIASAAPNVAGILAQRHWQSYDVQSKVVLPDERIAPVMYFGEDAHGPGCGLLQDGQPQFIEILAPEAGELYPHCSAISGAAAFDMGGKHYLVIQYTDRETREDSYEQFFYVSKGKTGAYEVEKKLNGAHAGFENGGKDAKAVRITDGIKLAKAAYLKQALPGLEWLPRDFIADPRSAFGILKDTSANKCVFAVENAGTVSQIGHDAFSSAACRQFVASGRLEKDGRIFYLGLYDSSAGPRQAAIFSVPGSSDGQVRTETALAAAAVKAGASADIKTLKKYLAAQPDVR